MQPLSLSEIQALTSEATTVSPLSSQQPGQTFSMDDISSLTTGFTPKPQAPASAPTAFDSLSALQTKSTGLNSVVRGVLQSGSNIAAAFGDFETATSLDLTTQKYFAPEAPNFNQDTGTFAYESLASNTPQLALSIGLAAVPIVGIPLSIASVALPQFGESRKAILEATGQDDPYAALAPAAANTALDLAVPMRIARKLGLTSILKNEFDEVKKGAAKYIGKETATTAGMEGLTELAQWSTNLATTRFLTDKNVLDRLTPAEQQDALNNFFGGVFGGGGFGLGASAYTAYKQGETGKALEKELSDLDDLLNSIKVDPSAPATATATPTVDSVQTPTLTNEAAIPPVTATSSTALPQGQTMISGVKYSLANHIRELPKPVYDMTVAALEARRQELTSLIGSIDTELALQALSVPTAFEGDALRFPNQHLMNKYGTEGLFNQFGDRMGNTVYVRTADDRDVPYPTSMMAGGSGSQLSAVSAVTSNARNKDTLFDAGAVLMNTLSRLGMDKAPNGNSVKIIMNDVSNAEAQNGEISLGSIAYNGDSILVNINLKETANLKEQYETIFHELGHYVSTKIAVTSPESLTDALRSAYASYIKGGLSADKQQKATPGFTSFIDGTVSEADAQGEYQTSFSEWMAEGFRQAMHNRVADGSIDLRQAAPNLFDKLNTALRRLFRLSRKYVGSTEGKIETFQMFVDKALASRELRDVEAKLANMTESKAQELKEGNGKEELPEPEAKPVSDKMPLKLAKYLVNIANKTKIGAFRGLDPLKGKNPKELTWTDYEGIFLISPQLKTQADFLKPVEDAYQTWKAASAPAKDFEVTNFLTKLGLKKQASNVNHMVDVNMGILGDSVLGSFFRSTMTPLQVAEQANNRGFSLGRKYMEIVQRWQLMKTTVVEMADKTLKQWRNDGKESTDRISKALYVISTKSDELGRRLTPNELDQVFNSLNMTQADRDSWAKVDESFSKVLDQMWASTLLDISRTYNPNPRDRQAAKDFRDAYLAAKTQTDKNLLVEQYTGQPLVDANLELNPMAEAIDNAQVAQGRMRNKNYFPRSRMGEYVVRIKAKAKGDEWEGHIAKSPGETLGFYAFDTEAEQRSFMDEIATDAEDLSVLAHKLDSEVFSVMGLPAGIIDQIVRDMDSNPTTKLTALQRELLNDIALQRSPGKKFLRHMTKRRGIAGYSEDAIRVYANYMSMASNHLARTEYAPELSSVISEMNYQIQNPGNDFALVNDWNVLKDYFVRHFDYIMKPDNDWATLRSIGFLWYLGFNVKSAIVNLMQTPMVTLPVLSKDIGTAKAAGRIATAMKDVVQHLREKSSLSADELSMLDYMLRANLIDESLVSELAGLGEADVLQRLIPGMSAQSVLTKVSWYGGAMFRMGEKFNRYSTALASYRIAKTDLKMSHEDAIQYSVDAIQGSQFEYAKFNRPQFMRGKKSVIFLFWQYMQHASYLFFGGKGARVAKRMWLMTLAIAGLEGLPFAQLLMKTIDFTGTAVRDVFGVADPKVETNKMIREMISNIYDRPDDIMKGMSYQWGLGPFHLLRPLGVPVPNVTTEGSLGFGNPVPWFDGLMDPTVKDMDKALGQTAATMLGPIGGMVLGVIEALGYSKEEDNWKRWEKTLPVFMKNASQGARWMTQGEETTSNGMQVVQFETPEQRAEVALKSLGFTPTRLDQTRRQMRSAQESLLYYQARKQMLMDDLWYAKQTKDREFMADARQAIRDYNTEVRKAKLGQFIIKADSLTTSLSERTKARALSERGISSDPRQEALRRQAERLIPVTAKGEEK